MVTLSEALVTLSAGEQLYARTSVLNDTVRLSVHHWHCHSNSISHSASFFLHPAQLSITTDGNSQPLDFFYSPVHWVYFAVCLQCGFKIFRSVQTQEIQ